MALNPPTFTEPEQEQLGRAFGSATLLEKFIQSVAIRVIGILRDASEFLEHLRDLVRTEVAKRSDPLEERLAALEAALKASLGLDTAHPEETRKHLLDLVDEQVKPLREEVENLPGRIKRELAGIPRIGKFEASDGPTDKAEYEKRLHDGIGASLLRLLNAGQPTEVQLKADEIPWAYRNAIRYHMKDTNLLSLDMDQETFDSAVSERNDRLVGEVATATKPLLLKPHQSKVEQVAKYVLLNSTDSAMTSEATIRAATRGGVYEKYFRKEKEEA